jgi:hypothetical protein
MMCGRMVLPEWSFILSIVQLVINRTLPAFLLPGTSDDPNGLRECLAPLRLLRVNIVHKRQQMRLLDLLKLSHPFKATDPRDKVYSLLGLAVDRDELGLEVDYTCTTEELYITVASTLFATHGNLDLLYDNLGEKSLLLPSWVPDWSTWRYGTLGTTVSTGYWASGYTQPQIRVANPGNKLEVTGCFVGKVVRLGDGIARYYWSCDEPSASERNAWLQKQENLIQQMKLYTGSSSISEALWRTLIGNITFYEEVAGNEYKAYFDAHIKLGGEISALEKNMAREFIDSARRRSRYRRIAVIEGGYLGSIPDIAEVGDWVCIFHGGRHFFVVRENGLGFTYIGHAYVHGLMNGEFLQKNSYSKTTITLV